MAPSSHKNFRIRGIPLEFETRAAVRDLVKQTLTLESNARVTVYSLAISPGDHNSRTATLGFLEIPECLSDRSRNEWIFHLPDGDDIDFSKSIVFDTHFAGFTPLQRTTDADCHVDVIAVCGLGGHALGSFKEKNGPFVWLRDALPLDVPHARILTYGYDTQIIQSNSFQNLMDLGRALRVDLEGIRDPNHPRPMAFIGHSLGGLVIKEAIVRLKEEPFGTDSSISDAISGFAFFGVPHQGLAVRCLVPLVKDYPNRGLLESLNTNSALLDRLEKEFSIALGIKRRPLVSFYETKKSPTAVQAENGKWEMTGPSEILVEVCSATCGSNHQHPIDRNHSEMVKYSTIHDVLYKRVEIALRPLLSMSRGRINAAATEAGVKTLVELSDDEKDCLRSLAFQEQDHRYSEIYYAKETCGWLLEDSQYQSWMNKSSGLFWVKGTPGTGKSALMKFAVDMMDRRKSRELVVSFFVQGRGVTLQRTPLGIFRALLSSILRGFPASLTELTSRFKDKEARYGSYEQKNGWRWTEKELEEFLSVTLVNQTKSQPVVIFIDALDECGEDSAKGLLTYFKNIMGDVERENALVKICFSSRHYPILGVERPLPTVYVEQRNDKDIMFVVQDRLKEIEPREARQQIETEIRMKAQGGFQWAMLITRMIHDAVATGTRTESLYRMVRTIPEDLNELYAVILKGRAKSEKHQMIKLFQWVLFSERPLSAQELREALATDKDMPCTTISELRQHKNWSDTLAQFELRVRHISKGLVEFQTRDVWELYEVDGEDWNREAQFIHQSAADFILNRFLNGTDHQHMSQSVAGASHFEISRSFLRYLTLTEVLEGCQLPRGKLSTTFPLLPYGVTYLLSHVEAVEDVGIPQTDLLKLIQWGRSDRFKMLATVWRVMDPDCNHVPMGWPFLGATPLHVLVGFGSASFLDVFLQKDETILDAKDASGNTPLIFALREGREDLALLLLNRSKAWQFEQHKIYSSFTRNYRSIQGRDYLSHVNAVNNDDETPLSVAVSSRADEAIFSLINAGADVTNEKGLLFYAIKSRNMDLLSTLIKEGANLNGAVFYAIQSLSRVDNPDDEILREIVSDLLDSGANTSRFPGSIQDCGNGPESDDGDEEEEEAIIIATRVKSMPLVGLLLSHGALCTSKGRYGNSPLIIATSNQDFETAEILLRVSPESAQLKNDAGETALDIAVSRRLNQFVLLLMQNGDGISLTQAHVFKIAGSNQLDLMEAILQADANVIEMVNEIDKNSGMTAYAKAFEEGFCDMTKLLLATGKIKSKPAGIVDILWRASQEEDSAIVKDIFESGLFERSSDISAMEFSVPGEDMERLLSFAAQAGGTTIIQLLLDTKEVHVNRKDGDGRTPLFWAAYYGHEATVKLLRDSGMADLDAVDIYGQTPTSIATFRGHHAIVDLLSHNMHISVSETDEGHVAPDVQGRYWLEGETEHDAGFGSTSVHLGMSELCEDCSLVSWRNLDQHTVASSYLEGDWHSLD